MIIKIDDHISFQIHFDPADREAGFDDDVYFAIEETPPTADIRMLAADQISMLLTPEQAEKMAQALWQAAQDSRSTPKDGKKAKEQPAPGLLGLAYPNLVHWIQEMGWVELGQDEHSKSLVRVLDDGGLVWESSKSHKTLAQALEAADIALGTLDE